MSEKLTWDEIKELYRDEWVELVDFEWDMAEPYPKCGIVRFHNNDKKELKRILQGSDRPKEAALVFTGDKLLPEGHIFSANLHQYMRAV